MSYTLLISSGGIIFIKYFRLTHGCFIFFFPELSNPSYICLVALQIIVYVLILVEVANFIWTVIISSNS